MVHHIQYEPCAYVVIPDFTCRCDHIRRVLSVGIDTTNVIAGLASPPPPPTRRAAFFGVSIGPRSLTFCSLACSFVEASFSSLGLLVPNSEAFTDFHYETLPVTAAQQTHHEVQRLRYSAFIPDELR